MVSGNNHGVSMSRSTILNVKNLSLYINEEPLLESLSLSVAEGEMVCLMGPNGCGKSTLLRIVLGEARPDQRRLADILTSGGMLHLAPDTEISYLPQRIEGSLPVPPPGDTDTELRSRTQAIIDGVPPLEDSQLSLGQLQKRTLARVIESRADLYLLDEPTNYLDLGGLESFEEAIAVLKRRGKALLIVTHDRTLADNLADRTIYISPNGVYQSQGGFSAAWDLAFSDYEARTHRAADIRSKIKQLQQDARRRMGWSAAKEKSKRGAGAEKPHIGKLAKKMAARSKAVAKRAEAEQKRLNETKPFVPKKVNLKIGQYEVRNRPVASFDRVGFTYPGSNAPTLSDVEIDLSTQDKVCVLGHNGCGKTTLLNLICGRLEPEMGLLRRNQAVKSVYLSQGLKGFFSPGTLLRNLTDTGVDETTIRQYLGAALLRRDKVTNSVESFSHGELMRAAIVKCILQKAEFLLLDEPTSHLDIESIQVLERLLQDFPGGYLVVSHDRTFVENVADQLFLMAGRRIRLI